MSAYPSFARPDAPPVALPVARLTFHASRYATLSLSAFVSVLLLIAMGSIVRVTGNGLGCPDWPLCYGQALPPWAVAPWVEFSHRLLGAIASAQIAAMGVLAWRGYRREAWVFRPAVVALGLLVVQVTLGGLHVIYELPPQTGWIHTAVAMIIAALIAAQVAVTHPAARELSARAPAILARDRGLLAALAATAAAAFLLILTGSYVTRSGASLACPAFPYCGGEASSATLRLLMNIQMLHRFMAYGVALTACLTLWRLIRAARGPFGKELRAAALALTVLIAVQFGLGISNVLLHLPQWSRTLHLLVAALLWTGLVMLWVTLRRGELAAR